jgi:hypothetical protein
MSELSFQHTGRVTEALSFAQERRQAERERIAAAGEHARERADAERARAGAERERLSQAAADGRERVQAERDRRQAAGQDGRERTVESAERHADVQGWLSLLHDEFVTSAFGFDGERTENERDRRRAATADGRERAASDHERRNEALDDAHARLTELGEVARVWHDHTVSIAGMSIGPPSRPATRAGNSATKADRPAAKTAPARARRTSQKTAGKKATRKPKTR